MPAAADVGGLVGFFEHFGDLGMSVDGVEETVDVDVAEATGERLVLVGCEVLISEEQDAVLGPRVDELRRLVVGQLVEGDVGHVGAEGIGDRGDLHLPILARSRVPPKAPGITLYGGDAAFRCVGGARVAEVGCRQGWSVPRLARPRPCGVRRRPRRDRCW